METVHIILKNGKPATKFVFKSNEEAQELLEILKDAYPNAKFTCEEFTLYADYVNLMKYIPESKNYYKNISEKAEDNMLLRRYEITLKNAETNNHEKVYLTGRQVLNFIRRLKNFNEDFIIKAKSKTSNTIKKYVIQEKDYCKLQAIRSVIVKKYNQYIKENTEISLYEYGEEK